MIYLIIPFWTQLYFSKVIHPKENSKVQISKGYIPSSGNWLKVFPTIPIDRNWFRFPDLLPNPSEDIQGGSSRCSGAACYASGSH